MHSAQFQVDICALVGHAHCNQLAERSAQPHVLNQQVV